MSLVGGAVGVTARALTGTGEQQDPFDLPDAALGTGAGRQEAAMVDGTVKSTSSRALAKLRVRADDAVPAEAIGSDRQ